jgi:hypothetical protein
LTENHFDSTGKHFDLVANSFFRRASAGDGLALGTPAGGVGTGTDPSWFAVRRPARWSSSPLSQRAYGSFLHRRAVGVARFPDIFWAEILTKYLIIKDIFVSRPLSWRLGIPCDGDRQLLDGARATRNRYPALATGQPPPER